MIPGSSFHNEAWDLGFSTCLLEFLGLPSPIHSQQFPPLPEGLPSRVWASRKFPTSVSCPSRPLCWVSCLILFLGPGSGDGHYVPTPHRLPVQPYRKPHWLASQGPFQVAFSLPLARAGLLSVWPQVGASGTRRANTVRPSGPNSIPAGTPKPGILGNHLNGQKHRLPSAHEWS